jgi:hypothetical protein
VRRAAAVLAVAAILVAAGCGDGTDPNKVVAQTADNLATIRSGTLGLRLIVTPRDGKHPFGFVLRGPFSLRRGGLPVASITYTQIANGRSATAKLVSDGKQAFVTSNGTTVELPAAQERALRLSGAALAASGGLGQLGIGDWMKNPKLSDGGTVGGAETDRITADLNVVNATNGLLELARLLGRNAQPLKPSDEGRLERAVRSSSFVVYTGKQDRLLRRLKLVADLGFDVPAQLKAALGNVVGAKIDFQLDVANPNEPVTVQKP